MIARHSRAGGVTFCHCLVLQGVCTMTTRRMLLSRHPGIASSSCPPSPPPPSALVVFLIFFCPILSLPLALVFRVLRLAHDLS